jgi:hypothetical protein
VQLRLGLGPGFQRVAVEQPQPRRDLGGAEQEAAGRAAGQGFLGAGRRREGA